MTSVLSLLAIGLYGLLLGVILRRTIRKQVAERQRREAEALRSEDVSAALRGWLSIVMKREEPRAKVLVDFSGANRVKFLRTAVPRTRVAVEAAAQENKQVQTIMRKLAPLVHRAPN